MIGENPASVLLATRQRSTIIVERVVYMRVRSIVWSISSVMMFAVGIAAAQATTWDAFTGFHDGTIANDASQTWQYGEVVENFGGNGPYSLYAQFGGVDSGSGTDGSVAWTSTPYRFVGVDTAGSELHAMPGDTVAAYVGWKSPIAGTVNASFLLTDRNDLSSAGAPDFFDGVEYWLWKTSGTTPLAHALVAEGGTGGNNVSVAVTAGDMLYLLIGPGIDHPGSSSWPGRHGAGDLTGISFSVTSVPEPAAIVMAATALLGLLAYAWRKHK